MDLSLYLTAPGARFWTASAPVTLDEAIATAARLGYDAVEVMPRDAHDPDPDWLRATAGRHGLRVLCLATGFAAIEYGLTFTHPDPETRQRAVAAVCRCLDAARRAGAPLVSIGIIRGKLQAGGRGDEAARAEAAREKAMAHLTSCLRECGLYAADLGLTLALEPGNRYETDFIHTVDEGLALLRAVDLPSVRLMVDTFHMNIEEVSLPDAIRRAGPHLAHVHLTDSNRKAPGWGHLDFGPIVGALREIGYGGPVGLEMMLTPDLETAARQGVRLVRGLLG